MKEEYKPILISIPRNMQEILDEINEDTIRDMNTNPCLDIYDPTLIDIVRKSLPSMMAYDICGVQPMTGPTGSIFAMKAVYRTIAQGMREHPYATLKHLEEMGYHD